MKKLLATVIILIMPSSIFALAGFGLQFGQDFSKLEGQSATEGSGVTEVKVKSYEMDSNPVGLGGYAFIDLFGFALEAEGDFAFGEYKFDFINPAPLSDLEAVPFGWGRASYAVTLKKNLMDISIPILAKAAINAGIGFNGHSSTPRASISMVKELVGDNLATLDITSPDSDLEAKLIKYLEENLTESKGLHIQTGLRFKVLMLDTHFNIRYTIAEDVYQGKKGYAQAMFKMGMAF